MPPPPILHPRCWWVIPQSTTGPPSTPGCSAVSSRSASVSATSEPGSLSRPPRLLRMPESSLSSSGVLLLFQPRNRPHGLLCKLDALQLLHVGDLDRSL